MNLGEKIIAAAKSPLRLVKSSLCGEVVYIRSLTLSELAAYTSAIKPLDDDKDRHVINLYMIAAMVRDEEGRSQYTYDAVKAGDLDCLPAADVHAFVEACVGIINKPMDMLRKNSDASLEDSSFSGSPGT